MTNQSTSDISPITDNLLEGIATGRLVIDCPEVTLTQLGVSTPKVIHGRGMIFLESDPVFKLRMYADPVEQTEDATQSAFSMLKRMRSWKDGEAIPEDEYFQIEVVDLSGFRWVGEQIFIREYRNGKALVITAEITELRYRTTGLKVVEQAFLKSYFFEPLRLPLYQPVETHTSANGETLAQSFERKRTKFEDGDLTFVFQRVEENRGSTVMLVTSTQPQLHVGLETRILESLRYVTMSPVWMRIVEKRQGDIREAILSPRRIEASNIFGTPVVHNQFHRASDFWNLFKAYLRYTLSATDPTTFHPLSSQLHHVISSETQHLDLTGLLVSIAVEGVLSKAFPELAAPSQEFKVAVDETTKLLSTTTLPIEALRPRVIGAVSQMKTSRAKDKLIALREQGIITEKMEAAWGKLRNSAAHATVNLDEAAKNDLWIRTNCVYTLLNLIIFKAIGYSGQYRDYSMPGWPIVKFQGVVASPHE